MDRFESAFDKHTDLLPKVRALRSKIDEVAFALIQTLETGGKVLLCGNGGSAADAQHIAAELTGRYIAKNRRPLPAVALTTDTSALTAIGNDFGFDQVFSRQVQALATRSDLLFGISTSGNSNNVIEALRAARLIGCRTVALTGGDGGQCRSEVDICLAIPSTDTPRVQEMHILIAHILCDMIDEHFAAK